ncbi:hypothetical protein [Halochromatium glycolicum]|uniref:Uncharacterized protein n=1 Tax=Halochromatium glycolicum TaxID=85075 RepID=A0AAJ0U6X0_9GAMM|nr:hypothetical protein [Halochromatium glycolicum]MBK1706424.1 hypothetical protein [Halochromatium glycolicum]
MFFAPVLALLLGLPGSSVAGDALGPGQAGRRGNVLDVELSALDANGLVGPPDGKRALSYEFCVPSDDRPVSVVRRIDPSTRFFPASPGRIGCSLDQVLVIGHTHQPGFADVLRELAELPEVERIVESHFE